MSATVLLTAWVAVRRFRVCGFWPPSLPNGTFCACRLSGRRLGGDASGPRQHTSNLEILYPQAIASVVPYNPEGCWDWWGYDGPDFAVKNAPQMVSIMNMVHTLGG